LAVNFGKKKAKAQAAPGNVAATPSFMKKGKDAAVAMKNEEKIQKERQNQVWRFWMPDDGETQLTFLDGHLDEDGMLDCPMWYEHNLQIAGKWGNHFTCVKEEEPCPLCDQAGSYLAAGFTVIDHTAYKSKKSGKVVKDTIKLFVCKQATLKLLQKIATKRGGLAGITFDVSRTGDNSANVGNMFDYLDQNKLPELQKEFGSTKKGEEKIIAPLDYGKQVIYRNADELRKLGFGAPVVGGDDAYKDVL